MLTIFRFLERKINGFLVVYTLYRIMFAIHQSKIDRVL